MEATAAQTEEGAKAALTEVEEMVDMMVAGMVARMVVQQVGAKEG